MKMKKLLCIASLMMLVFLVGCKKEEKLDIAELQYDWIFVEAGDSLGGEPIPHTPGLEDKEPAISFDGSDVKFSMNGETNSGVVEADTDCYNITYPDSSSRPMEAKLSDNGNTLTLTIKTSSFDLYFVFEKQ